MIGALIGLGFGFLWLLAGAIALPAPAGLAAAAAGAVLFALGAVRTTRSARPAAGTFRWPYFAGAVAAEIAGIVFAQNVPAIASRFDLLLPMIGIIVGLHFIGLKLATGLDRFLLLSAALVLVNLAALLSPLGRSARVGLSGFGSAAALFASAVA